MTAPFGAPLVGNDWSGAVARPVEPRRVSVVVAHYADEAEALHALGALDGQLAVTLHHEPGDDVAALVDRDLLRRKAELVGALQRTEGSGDAERRREIRTQLVTVEADRRMLRQA